MALSTMVVTESNSVSTCLYRIFSFLYYLCIVVLDIRILLVKHNYFSPSVPNFLS